MAGEKEERKREGERRRERENGGERVERGREAYIRTGRTGERGRGER